VKELRTYLKQKLPEYMVPASFVLLESFPLTPNGKIDRKALPVHQRTRGELEAAFVSPRTSVEKRLADIWAQILSINEVGIHDSFFELGGNSLLAMQAMTRLSDTFHTDIPLRAIFEKPTVAGLAEIIETVLWAGDKKNNVTSVKTLDEELGEI